MLRSLSGRFLILTVLFVMLAEVLIFVPSVARFRQDYLLSRLERAQIASLVLLADDMIDLGNEISVVPGLALAAKLFWRQPGGVGRGEREIEEKGLRFGRAGAALNEGDGFIGDSLKDRLVLEVV